MCSIRFDMRATRSQRMMTNKFSLASEIWYPFIETASNVLSHEGLWQLMNICFQPRQGFAFFSNVNKPDKF